MQMFHLISCCCCWSPRLTNTVVQSPLWNEKTLDSSLIGVSCVVIMSSLTQLRQNKPETPTNIHESKMSRSHANINAQTVKQPPTQTAVMMKMVLLLWFNWILLQAWSLNTIDLLWGEVNCDKTQQHLLLFLHINYWSGFWAPVCAAWSSECLFFL